MWDLGDTTPAIAITARWFTLSGGQVLAHEDMPATFVPARGAVTVYDENRERFVTSSTQARNLDDATRIAVGLVLELDMRADAIAEIEARERARQAGRDHDDGKDQVRQIRRRLSDPATVLHLLGLTRRSRRQPRGVMVLCPFHKERTPSCSVRVGKDGTLQVKCHGCQNGGDVFSLIAAVHRLELRREFGRVLEVAACLAGVTLARRRT